VRWDFCVEHWTARLLADAALVSVMGSASGWIAPAQAARPVKIPSIEYGVLTDVEEELFNPFELQVDFWARGLKKAAQIERRIRLLTHSDVAQELGGERMWIQYQDGQQLDYPAEPGVVHKFAIVRFEVIREKYLTP
jgi:hypothetical protein